MKMWVKRNFSNCEALYKRERPLMLLCRCAYILLVVTHGSPSSLEKEGSEHLSSIYCLQDRMHRKYLVEGLTFSRYSVNSSYYDTISVTPRELGKQ